MGWFTPDGQGIVVRLWVTPKAASNAITGLVQRPDGDVMLGVRVTALPEKGAANLAVIATLSKALKLPKSDFAIVSGETGRAKALRLETEGRPE